MVKIDTRLFMTRMAGKPYTRSTPLPSHPGLQYSFESLYIVEFLLNLFSSNLAPGLNFQEKFLGPSWSLLVFRFSCQQTVSVKRKKS